MAEGLGADVTPGPAKLLEGDGTSLPEMDSKKESTTEQATKEPIKANLLDSLHHVNGETKETDHISAANFPNDAVDEWPAPKKTHSFYFVRVRFHEDPMLKPKLEAADRDIYKKSQVRFQIIEALRDKKSERANVIFQLKPLNAKEKQLRITIDEKRKEMEPTQASLGKLQCANNAARENSRGLCFSEEDLDDQLISCDMDGVRKEQQALRAKIKHLEEELKSIDNAIDSMQEELDVVSNERAEAYKTANELRKARDEASSSFNEYRSILNTAHKFSAKNCIAALEKLSRSEVEKFMSQYSSRQDFRDNYKRRIMSTLESRQMCRDGTTKNPDEKILIEQQPPNRPEKTPAQNTVTQTIEQHEETLALITVKQTAGELALAPKDTVLTHNVQDEMPKDEILKPTKVEPAQLENNDVANVIGESKELPKPNEIDAAAELKERKRQEEIAKAKLALERKRKLAEKAAAKAAAWAQKEAEKAAAREKEKQARKKGEIVELLAPSEQTETDTKSVEVEEAETKPEAPGNTKEKMEKVRFRGRIKSPVPVPKAIIKRKRYPYGTFAGFAVVILAFCFLVYAAISDKVMRQVKSK